MRRPQKWKRGRKTKTPQWLVSWRKWGQSPVINLSCSSPCGLWMKIFDVMYCSLLFYLSWGQEVTVKVKRSVRHSHFQSSPEWCQAFLSWTKVAYILRDDRQIKAITGFFKSHRQLQRIKPKHTLHKYMNANASSYKSSISRIVAFWKVSERNS